MTGLDIFQGFALELLLAVHLGFPAAFGAADSVPFRPDRYGLKRSVFLANELINRHCILLADHIFTTYRSDSPIYSFGQYRR